MASAYDLSDRGPPAVLGPAPPPAAPAEYRLTTTLAGIIEEISPAACRLINTHQSLIVGKPVAFFVSPADRQEVYRRLACLNRASSRPQALTLEIVPRKAAPVPMTAEVVREGGGGRVSPEGQLYWRFRPFLVRDGGESDGADQGLACAWDNAPLILLVVDATGRVARSNPYFRMLAEGREYDTWFDLMPPAARRAVAGLLRDVLDTGAAAHTTQDTLTGQHGSLIMEWGIHRITRGRALLVGTDVTALQSARRRADQAERLAAVGQMFSQLSHEARGALGTSRANLRLLSVALEARPAELELLARVERAEARLVRLLEDIGGFTSSLSLQLADCDLPPIWRVAWERVEPSRRGDRLALVEELGPPGPPVVMGDPFWLDHLFRNLFENAAAVSPPGGRVTVKASRAVLRNAPAVRVAIRDQGPGFSAEARRRAFEPFFTSKRKGTGLGLVICRRIVEAHGGEIWLGQPAGPGAEIIFVLPAEGT